MKAKIINMVWLLLGILIVSGEVNAARYTWKYGAYTAEGTTTAESGYVYDSAQSAIDDLANKHWNVSNSSYIYHLLSKSGLVCNTSTQCYSYPTFERCVIASGMTPSTRGYWNYLDYNFSSCEAAPKSDYIYSSSLDALNDLGKKVFNKTCGTQVSTFLGLTNYYCSISSTLTSGFCSADPQVHVCDGSNCYDTTYLVHMISYSGNCMVYTSFPMYAYQNPVIDRTDKNNGNHCPANVKDPVNTFTGNSYQLQSDYADGGLGNLTFTRVYNSQDSQSHGLGVSWQSNYHRGIFYVVSNIVNVFRPDGKVFSYSAPTSGNIWIKDADVIDTLEKTTTGWKYTTNKDTVEEYDTTGRLLKITDKSGYSQSLFYNTSNQLDHVDDTLARRLSFVYDAQGRVANLIDPAQRTYLYGYDANNNLATVTYPDSTVKTYLYEDARFSHALTGIIDQNNVRYVTWEFDANGRVSANYKPGNIERGDIAYNADGTTTVTNGRSKASTYSFIKQFGVGLVTNITGPGCSSCGSGDSSYQYDPTNSNLLSKTVKGLTTNYSNYDSKGNAQSITEAAGTTKARTATYTYDPRFFSKVATKTQPSVCAGQNKITTYGYDNFGNTTSVTINGFKPNCTAVSRTTTLQYNGPLNQLSQIDGPRTDVSDITTFDYYPIAAGDVNSGRLQRVTLANGTLARNNIQYTPTGKVLSESRPNGVNITYSYEPLTDRLSTVTTTDGINTRVSSWSYYPTGLVKTITSAANTATPITLTFGYDDAHRLTRITDALGNYIEYQLDTEGNKEHENIVDSTGVLQKQLNQTFDDYNRLATTTQANENRTTHFSPDGTLHDTLDGKNVAANYQYDDLKRLLNSTQDVGGTDPTTQNALTQYGYDVQDNLTSVTDPVNGNTTYAYDDLGNLLTQTSPDTGTTQLTYDNAGNVLSRTDAKNQVFGYQYDALNRLTLITAPNTALNITYSYDTCTNGVGRLCSITHNGFVVTYTYNGLGEVQSSQYLNYTYDDHGRLDTITYPSHNTLTYHYDSVGKVNSITAVINGVSQTLASNIGYQPFGPMNVLTYGNNLNLLHTFDSAYRLLDNTQGNALNQTGSLYDANGNLNQRSESLLTTLYNYDALERLDTASGWFGARDYNLDKNGNRSQDIAGSTTTTYSYLPNTNRLNTINGTAVVLDPNGNTTSLRGVGLTYDNFNRLSTVSTAVYGYNGLHQRVTKSINSVATTYLYGLNGELLVELDQTGVTQTEYYYLNGVPLALTQRTTIAAPPPPADVIIDNDTAATTRSSGWTSSTNKLDYGANYRYTGTSTTPRWFRWTPTLPLAGQYDLYTWYVTNTSNSTTAPYTIVSSGTSQTVNINQRVNGGQWILLGRFNFSAAGGEYVQLTNANGRVTADAMKFVYVPTLITPQTQINTYYVHTDQLGTPRAMTNASQKLIWSWNSDPFGVGAANDDPDADGVKVTMNLRFPGQYFDAESGLHYNYHRYYDPQSGRYVTSDPIGLGGGLNTYGYVGGNPSRFIDPIGLAAWSINNSWSDFDKQGYANYAQAYIQNYNKPIDCADLALLVLIEYASENGLPLKLKYWADGQWNWYDASSDDFTSINQFRTTVLNNMGAESVIDNTRAVPLKNLSSGDLLMSKWPTGGGHTRVVNNSSCSTGKCSDALINWVQGNLSNKIPLVPEARKGDFSDIDGGTLPRNQIPRRWNFSQF